MLNILLIAKDKVGPTWVTADSGSWNLVKIENIKYHLKMRLG